MFGTLKTILVALCALGPTAALAQIQERVSFASGNDKAENEGSVTGNGYMDYLLGAAEGQQMAVSLITDGTAYFNILPPGRTGEAIYIGSASGNDATGVVLPEDGDYTIRVYLMGNDKDTGQTVPFTLSMTIM